MALLCSPAGAASISLGGNGGGLLGTGLLAGNSGGGSGGTSVSATVNTAGNGGALTVGGNASLTLGSQGTQGGSANVNLGNTGHGNVLFDLFGNGGQDGNAQVTLGVNGLNSGDDAGGSGNVRLDLFGDGSGAGLETTAATTAVSLASLEPRAAGAGCFSPNSNQVGKLADRHDYSSSTFATWNDASVVKVIDVGLCTAAAHTIAAQPNIGRLQTYVGGSSTLRGQLAQWGHKPGDVIAVDRQGKTLIFYVA